MPARKAGDQVVVADRGSLVGREGKLGGEDENPLAAIVHLLDHGAGFIDKAAVYKGLVSFPRGALVLYCHEEVFCKDQQFFPLRLIQKILHVGGICPPELHVEIVADALQIIVGRVVEEAQRGAQGHSILVFKVLLGVSVENELDKALVLGGDKECVDGKRPDDGVGCLDFLHQGVKGLFIPRQFVYLLGYIVGLVRMLGFWDSLLTFAQTLPVVVG